MIFHIGQFGKAELTKLAKQSLIHPVCFLIQFFNYDIIILIYYHWLTIETLGDLLRKWVNFIGLPLDIPDGLHLEDYLTCLIVLLMMALGIV